MAAPEVDKRICRCCNRQFDYPVPRSRATRFHCADCVELKPEQRKVFEIMNRRLKRQEAEIAKLKQPRAKRGD